MVTVANPSQEEAWNGWEGQAWAAHAARFDAMLGGFNEPLFAAASIDPTDRVVDLGCGTGQTTRLAASRAVRGRALGIDLSTPMLDHGRATAEREGLDNIAFEKGDIQVYPFPEHCFDVAISRGGVMFCDDLTAAFTNIRGALRPGGRLAMITAVHDPDGEESRATAALAPHMTSPSPAAVGMMSLAEPRRIHDVLAGSGFSDVSVTSCEAEMRLGADAADAADFRLSLPPVAHNLRTIDPARHARLRAELRAGFLPHETPTGVLVRGTVLLTTASAPTNL
ncbi:class I SAM-dependent methyltransferase [Spiractinospora alimapuensis]|uniref:class I SAM-dependent methyltransferase n=1 Tax=Spiractinospora alimapuensis TaxID=2820884 RepID=UPI001F4126F2|nr:class I SAM-dependent methyltransferase [Spiractinospora alimapuensis]QVQ53818.1 class I SAM-dependent methyltransferase [Spiractinospora alimapuensis]